tara:strand:- start:689 stop:943 length:255 start_codon:yes stop_codon:yes gene_type:complete
MRSNSGNRHALGASCLADVVKELAKATSVIHQELGDSTAANVGVMIDGSVLELACSRAVEQGDTQDVDAGRADVTSVNKQRHND